MTQDASEAGTHIYPYVIVDPQGGAVDRYSSEDTARRYLGEHPPGFDVIYDPKPRKLSQRLDLP